MDISLNNVTVVYHPCDCSDMNISQEQPLSDIGSVGVAICEHCDNDLSMDFVKIPDTSIDIQPRHT